MAEQCIDSLKQLEMRKLIMLHQKRKTKSSAKAVCRSPTVHSFYMISTILIIGTLN